MRHPPPAHPDIESNFPAAAAAAAPALPHELRVVTFNLHMEPGTKIAKALHSDRSLRDADLLVLEEVHRSGVGCSAACVIARGLGFYEVYAPGHTNGDGDDGVAILSRAPITSAQVIELPAFDVHINSGRRIAMAATIDQDGHPITVYAVHLENRLNVRDRRKQMLPVLAHAEHQPTPVIIAGDFNTSPFTWLWHLVPILTTTQDNNLEALVRKHGFTTPVEESGPTSRFIAMKLDAIYTRGFETKKFATADAQNVSDHLALWAVMHPRPH